MEWVIFIAISALAAIVWLSIRGAAWRTSMTGNKTRIYKGSRVTVFESDGGWKYCIADPHDRDPPYFSDPYPSQEAAIHEAMAAMDGARSKYLTKRETREQSLLCAADEIVSAEQVRLNKAKVSVARVLNGTTTKATTISNLQKHLATRARASDHLHSQLIKAGGRDDHMDTLAGVTKEYWEMKWQIDKLMDDRTPT